MSTKTDQFCDSLKVKLTKIQSQIDGVKSEVKTDYQHKQAALAEKLDAARASVAAKKQEAKAAEAKAQDWIKAKAEAGSDLIQTWRDKHEKGKLDRHANRAEQNAEAAIYYAEAALANAIEASYEAITARVAADLA
jgi:hypothetical protein